MSENNANDINIQLMDGDVRSRGSAQLPLNFIVNGTVAPDDVKIYIRQGVFKSLEKFAKSDISKELGSILLGDYVEYSGKIHIIISDYVEAKYTDASASTLTFTHETWDYVHKTHESDYPDKKILGWQHTHPGHGIFMSNYDMFIQENFFNLPFQIAYVIDPKQNLRSFFQWRGGKVEKLGGFYVYDEVGLRINIEAEQEKLQQTFKSNLPKWPVLPVVLILTLVLASAASFGVFFSKLGKEASLRKELESSILVQNNEIMSQKDIVQSLQDELSGKSIPTNDYENIEELIRQVNDQQKTIDEQNNAIKELEKQLAAIGNAPAVKQDNDIVFTYYTVEEGDTLIGICFKLKIDYSTNKNIIKAVNGIRDVNAIYVGQILLLPTRVN